MTRFVNVIKILGIIFILISCLSPYSGNDGAENGLPGTETPIVISDLFIQDSVNPEIRRFYTNDLKYRTPLGYTLWTFCSEEINFKERTVTVRKTYGSTVAGFGIIICAKQLMVGGSIETVFITVMINNNGQYAIGKVINASYTHLVNWTDGKGLSKSIGLPHKIKVIKDIENTNKYHLYINDVYERYFVDEETPRCEGTGRNGYIVVIAPDDLINTGVEVWFTE